MSIISQALSFITDMKLGHYVKVPPRQMFCAQVAAAVASSVAVVAVVQFQLTIDGMCDPAVNVHWVCGSAHAQYSSALLWGLIGPQRLFTVGFQPRGRRRTGPVC